MTKPANVLKHFLRMKPANRSRAVVVEITLVDGVLGFIQLSDWPGAATLDKRPEPPTDEPGADRASSFQQ